MSALLPTIRSFSDLIRSGELTYVWGEPGSGRDLLIARIIKDLGGMAHGVIPKNALTSLYQALPGAWEREDLDWDGILNWVRSSPYSLLIVTAPPRKSWQDLATILPMVTNHIAREGKNLVVIADVPERYRRETEENPTVRLDLDPASIQHPSCILHLNEIMWPGAVHVAKNRHGHAGIYRLSKDASMLEAPQ